MLDPTVDPHRPPPRPGPADRIGTWVRWFGLGRLVTAAVSVAVVMIGGWWLVRPPQLPVEATLPVAGATTSAGAASTVPMSDGPADSPEPAVEVVVHVAGAVVAPGVHRLPVGARVVDAVTAAGGPLPDAVLDAVNLAAPLADGQRLYVPRLGDDPAVLATPVAPADDPAAPAGPVGPVDLNRATVAELESLPGVGPATAAAIVEHRERVGPFASVDDLDDVPGIGQAKLDAIRDLVTV